MSQSSKTVEIKTVYEEEERSFNTSLYDSLETAFLALQAFVTDSYSLQDKLSKDDQILIQFKDDEGDLVTLGNIEDFKDALDLASEDNTSLVLYVTIQSFKHPDQTSTSTNAASDAVSDEKEDNPTQEGVEFGKNLFEDLVNHEEFKNEFISFLKTLLQLLKETAFDPSFDIETCVMQAVSSHDILMDYPLFRDHLFNLLKKPNLSNKIKPFVSMFLFNLQPSQIENWVNQAIDHYRASQTPSEATSSNNSNNSNNPADPFGSLFGQGGGGMGFPMQYLTSLLSGGSNNNQPFWNNNNDNSNTTNAQNDQKPTKGGPDDEEPVISSTIGTEYDPNQNSGNNDKQNGSNDNMSNEAPQDNWNMPPPAPGADFFAQLMNSAFGGNFPPNPPNNGAPSPHGHHGHHHGPHGFGGFGRGHPWRGRGHRRGGRRGMGPRGHRGPFRPPGGAFGGPLAQLLTSLAGGVNGAQQQQNGQQNQQNQQNEPLVNNNNSNDNVEGIVIKDDSTLGDGACVFANQILFKTWRIRNITNNNWDKGSIIKYIGEPFNPMINGASFVINNDKSIGPNDEIECQVCIVAPNENGEYKSEWCVELPGGNRIKLDKKLIVRINVLQDNMEFSAQDVEMRTSVKELDGETSMNASVISVINDDSNNNNNDNNNNNNVNDKGEDNDINALADFVSGMERVQSKEVNDEDIEMKDEIEDLAASMMADTDIVITGNDKKNDGQKQQDVNGNDNNDKKELFVFSPQLKSLQDMGFGEQNEELLKSLLVANEGNLDKVVGILSYA